jgi:hypothetical protein
MPVIMVLLAISLIAGFGITSYILTTRKIDDVSKTDTIINMDEAVKKAGFAIACCAHLCNDYLFGKPELWSFRIWLIISYALLPIAFIVGWIFIRWHQRT